jgi:hypothetical protein
MTPRGDDAEDPVPEDAAVEHGPDTGILCLAMMLQFHKMVADPEQLKHQYALTGTPIAMLGLLRAAKQLGLKALAPTIKPKRLAKANLPAIAEAPYGKYFILGRVSEDQALLKVRRLFGEVLIARFFLKLFGLASPLFFQVIIDEVLVHRGLTTLDVLVLGAGAIELGVALYGADRIMFGTDGSDFGAEWSNRAIEEARIEDWKKSHPRRHGGKTTPRLCRTGGIVPGGGITFVPDTPLFCLICTTAAVGGQSRVKYESWNPRACRRR